MSIALYPVNPGVGYPRGHYACRILVIFVSCGLTISSSTYITRFIHFGFHVQVRGARLSMGQVVYK